ncbi:hypothetical protein SprV_0301211000 [Sparganum proliferum]
MSNDEVEIVKECMLSVEFFFATEVLLLEGQFPGLPQFPPDVRFTSGPASADRHKKEQERNVYQELHEGAIQIKTGILRSLSEQQLVDCSWEDGNQGCNGGLMPLEFQYVQRNGIEADVNYKYTGRDGVCRYRRDLVVANVTGYAELPEGDEGSLQRAVATIGPISVGIDAADPGFMSYSHGVFVSKTCSPYTIDHGVLAVGYGTENGQPYWLVKNSWGRSWGENGYVKMARNRNNMCGIASMASYPIV